MIFKIHLNTFPDELQERLLNVMHEARGGQSVIKSRSELDRAAEQLAKALRNDEDLLREICVSLMQDYQREAIAPSHSVSAAGTS